MFEKRQAGRKAVSWAVVRGRQYVGKKVGMRWHRAQVSLVGLPWQQPFLPCFSSSRQSRGRVTAGVCGGVRRVEV